MLSGLDVPETRSFVYVIRSRPQPDRYYVGLTTDSYVNTAKSPVTVRVQTVAVDGKRQANVPVQLTFFKREWEQVLFLKRQIAVLQAERRCALRKSEEPDMEKIRQLSMLRGIGENGSWVFVREFFGWRKFHNRREVGSLAGLTPTPYQSGRTMREQGVSKAGNRHVRGDGVRPQRLSWIDGVLSQKNNR